MIFVALLTISIVKLSLVLFLLSLPCIVIDVYLICGIIDWGQNRSECHPKLTFRQFIRIYTAIPKEFTLESDRVIYKKYSYDSKRIDFKTPIDSLIYKKFYKKIENRDKNITKMQVQADFLKDVQQDINRRYAEINSFVKDEVQRQCED